MQDSEFDAGLDPRLRQRIADLYISEGRLFGSIGLQKLDPEEQTQLVRSGWTVREYQDRPVVEPPSETIDWDALRQHRKNRILGTLSERELKGWPWSGDRRAILDEVLDSAWEEKEEEIRTFLNAWTYASLWYGSQDDVDEGFTVEQRQEFFFYTERMRQVALAAIDESITAPDEDANFWELIRSLAH